ncbi:MAG: ABC transporter ATP-binding protein [Parvibaculaceae bacterium]|nr:ABC transporter ATP-binding protein [Parvibaculaceae bacterium]
MNAPPSIPSWSQPPGIRIENLTLRFGDETVFENLSFEIEGGSFVALLGPSGIGKTSLLKTIAGLTPPVAGCISASDGAPLAHRIAYMGQQDLLFPWLSVLNNVMLGSRLRGEKPDRARARALLAEVGLAERADALPATLSGGMRQRAALARTLYEHRPVLLLDEPFSALDAITRARLQERAAELLRNHTVLLITHDPMEACRLSHQLRVMTGYPATLGEPIEVPGATPRAPDDPALLNLQAELLKRLLAGSET